MEGPALGSSYGRLLLFGTSYARNAGLSVASQGRMLSPGKVDIERSVAGYFVDDIGWQWLEGDAHEGATLRDHLSIWLLFSRAGFVLKEGQSHVVTPRRRPCTP